MTFELLSHNKNIRIRKLLDDERLKGKNIFGADYFDDLLDRIREIRISERRYYQKITDIYTAPSWCSIANARKSTCGKTPPDWWRIGLLVCSDMDKTDVQWSFKGISTPMGIATYNNIRIKDALPSQEKLAERVRLLQKELRETKRLMNKRDK